MSPCLCFGRRPAMEQQSGIITVFLQSTEEDKQTHWIDDPIFSYHCHHLQVLKVRPLCGQQLLGDEVGPVCWEPLENDQNEEIKNTEAAQMKYDGKNILSSQKKL